MTALLPLPVAIPLLAAALIAGTDHVTPRRVQDAIGVVAAAAATVVSVVVMLHAESHGLLVHWYGGWKPDGGVAIGIGFAADPFGAGMAALACGLVTLSLVYSLTYMREASRLFDVLMLVFCGAMAGFSLTGDIFNMFVWFELMGVAAYALAGFNVEELGPLQGAINFAISNTFGAYMILLGIGLLYARTGALNFAQIGHSLGGHKVDGLVIVAVALLVVGFLVKAAIVPFHFWLADGYAVAPAPVCVLFAGAMCEFGLYAVARIYWTVFAGPFGGHAGDIRQLLVWLGVLTALLGALMCFLQRHLKRMLAFSTISHLGIVLVAIGLLDRKGLAGAANLVLSHGLLKGGLFLASGVVLVTLRDIDELRLHGAGRRIPVVGVLWFLGSLGLSGAPYVGSFLGHSLVDDGAKVVGLHWVPTLIAVAAGVSSGAMLRAGARVFLGWGPKQDALLTPQPEVEPTERRVVLPLMIAVAAVAIVLGLVASVVPGLQQRSEHAAERFRDRAAYAERVLHDKPLKPTPHLAYRIETATTESWIYGSVSLALAVATAAFGLWRRRIPEAFRRATARVLDPPLVVLKEAHSGIVGDYVLWIVIGTGVIGSIWALTLR